MAKISSFGHKTAQVSSWLLAKRVSKWPNMAKIMKIMCFTSTEVPYWLGDPDRKHNRDQKCLKSAEMPEMTKSSRNVRNVRNDSFVKTALTLVLGKGTMSKLHFWRSENITGQKCQETTTGTKFTTTGTKFTTTGTISPPGLLPPPGPGLS